MADFKKLLEPGRIGNLKLKNRMVMAPMRTNFPGPQGEVTAQMIEYYRRRAEGGAGLITVESGYILDDNGVGSCPGNELGLFRETFIPGLNELVEAVHEAGARIAIQPHHAGRQAAGRCPVSISEIPCGYYQTPVRKLSISELEAIEDGFAEASLLAKKGGFDAVQLHFANGYLACQSLSPKLNDRTDLYGGTFERRLRFSLNIIAKTRKKVGPDYPLYCRMPTQEFISGGLTINETKLIAREFEKAGLCAIDLNSGIRESVLYTTPPACVPRGFAADLAKEVKEMVQIPVIIAGRINDPFLAEEILREGKSDFVALGRALIADPDFPRKVAENRVGEIRRCIACNEGCNGRLRSRLHIRCTVNPLAAREVEFKEEFPEGRKKKKIVIIGGGPAGLEAAYTLGKRGHAVTLWERSKGLGGEQLEVAVVPPHKEELKSITEFYQNQLAKLKNVKILLGKEAEARAVEKLTPDAVIIATGSQPLIPGIPGGEKAKNAREVLKGTVQTGKTVIVVGGNALGLETGEWLAGQRKKVVIVEMLEEIGADVAGSVKYALLNRLREQGVEILKGRKVVEVVPDGAICLDRQWRKSLLKADTVVFAVGSVSENGLARELQGKVPEVHVVGDAREPGKILNAVAEGYRVGRNL